MQQRENLSAYMDGHNVSREFTDKLCSNAELQQKWADYHAIRSVMRGEEQILGADFSMKMAELLENEEIESVVEPVQVDEQPKGLLLKLKRWGTPLMQAGIAASVCFVAVMGVNMMNSDEEVVVQTEQPVLQTLPFSNSVQPVSYNSPSTEQPTVEQVEAQQRRVNALLQNHELQRRTQLSSTEQERTDTETSIQSKYE